MVRPTPYIFFPLAITLALVHLFALQTKLYWYLPWFDVLMHTWGGFLVIFGLVMLGQMGSGRLRLSVWMMALGLFAVMVLWEVFEYLYVIDLSQPNLFQDTVLDILCGAVGGLIGYFLVKKTV